jgi:hypothetical protein
VVAPGAAASIAAGKAISAETARSLGRVEVNSATTVTRLAICPRTALSSREEVVVVEPATTVVGRTTSAGIALLLGKVVVVEEVVEPATIAEGQTTSVETAPLRRTRMLVLHAGTSLT